jgi:hypothetical protein
MFYAQALGGDFIAHLRDIAQPGQRVRGRVRHVRDDGGGGGGGGSSGGGGGGEGDVKLRLSFVEFIDDDGDAAAGGSDGIDVEVDVEVDADADGSEGGEE